MGDRDRKKRAPDTAGKALLLSLALILSYVESLIPVFVGIPGAKLGLANLVTVICLEIYDPGTAILINILRIFLSGFMFGNMFGIMYSISGAMFSFAAMVIVKKTGIFSLYGVSISGGVFHNIGQVITAMILLGAKGLLYYIPALLVFGVVTGYLIAFAAVRIIKSLRL